MPDKSTRRICVARDGGCHRRGAGSASEKIMRKRSIGAALAVAVAATALTPSVAGAEAIIIGQGRLPSLAVDAAGTGYVSWWESAVDSSLFFCRFPRGATACDAAAASSIPVHGDGLTPAPVIVSGSRVVAVAARYVNEACEVRSLWPVRLHVDQRRGVVRRGPRRRIGADLRQRARPWGHALRGGGKRQAAAIPERAARRLVPGEPGRDLDRPVCGPDDRRVRLQRVRRAGRRRDAAGRLPARRGRERHGIPALRRQRKRQRRGELDTAGQHRPALRTEARGRARAGCSCSAGTPRSLERKCDRP